MRRPDAIAPPLIGAAADAQVLIDGLDHPEGVVYDATRDVLHAGGEDGQLYTISLDGALLSASRPMAGMVLGLAVDATGVVVACNPGQASVQRIEDGIARPLLHRVGDYDLVLPNYPAFGPKGDLYVTDSGRWKADDGLVIHVDVDGAADVLTDQLHRFPNGCAVTPDGRWLWVVESQLPGVSRIDLRDGGPTELVVELPGTVPDGLAFTADGGAVISCYRPDRILHLDAHGGVTVLAEDREGTLLSAPTNVCFAGPQLDVLVSANLGRWHLTRLDTGLVGGPVHRPPAWAGAKPASGRVAPG